MGDKPTEIVRITKRGEVYTVEGVHDGKQISVDVHASRVNGVPRPEAERIFKRAVKVVRDAERDS